MSTHKLIGPFRVLLCLCFKTSLSAKFMQIKVIFIRMASHLDGLLNRGTRELGNGLLEGKQSRQIWMGEMTTKKSVLPKGRSPVRLSLDMFFYPQSHSVQGNEGRHGSNGSLVTHGHQTEDVMDENIDQTQPVRKKSEQQALIQTSHLESKQRTPFYVYFLTAFAAIGGFLFGYDTGVISGAMILIKEEFDLSSFWQELIVSVTIGAAILGALLGGFLNQRLGRKPLLVASALVFTVGAVVMGVAHSREILLIGRLTVGFGIGK